MSQLDKPAFNTKDISLIKEIQNDIYLDADPFQRIADSLGRPLDEVLNRIKELQTSGVIRRFGAALTPNKAGFKTNAMVVWDTEGREEEVIGAQMAAHTRVSHCYIRQSFNGFNYTLYTMIHANSEEELQAILGELAAKTGLTKFRILRTVKELKKTSPVYFG